MQITTVAKKIIVTEAINTLARVHKVPKELVIVGLTLGVPKVVEQFDELVEIGIRVFQDAEELIQDEGITV